MRIRGDRHFEGRHDARRGGGDRARRRHGGHRGLHAPHQLQRRPRDHPPTPARADPGAHDAGRHLRPDDRRRGGAQAHLQLARQPRRGRPACDPAAHRGRRPRTARGGGVQPLRHGWAVHGGEYVYAVPPLKPDVAIVHAQRADAAGDTQVWGLLGCQKEVAFAAERVIVVVEELVDESVVRADPNRTIIPGLIVDAVVVEPFGAHPSYAQGYYDRDNRFYIEWDAVSRDAAALDAWLDEWVHGVSGRAEYLEKLGAERVASLRPGTAPSGSVDYGDYR